MSRTIAASWHFYWHHDYRSLDVARRFDEMVGGGARNSSLLAVYLAARFQMTNAA
jgi:hypothetical protein